MLPDLQLAVRLQELDHRVTELTREISALPKQIAEIEKKLESHSRKLEADRAALSANQKDRKKNESDIQVQEQKISKLRDQMLGAKTNEQYRAFQHEIEFCEKEIRRAEDHILELMGESEPLDKNVKAAEVALKEEKTHVEAKSTRPGSAPRRIRRLSTRSTRSAPRSWPACSPVCTDSTNAFAKAAAALPLPRLSTGAAAPARSHCGCNSTRT